MPRITCLLLLLLSFQPIAFAQDDVEWYQRLQKRGVTSFADTTLQNAAARVLEMHEMNDAPMEARARMELGVIHLASHNYDKAMDEFIKALSLEDSMKIERGGIFTYLLIGDVFLSVGDFRNGADAYETALSRIAKEDSQTLVLVLLKLGKVYQLMSRTEESFETYQAVLRNIAGTSQPELESKAEALFNLGHLYIVQKKYDDALRNHKEALALWRQTQDRLDEATALNDIGELYLVMGNPEKALANHVVALEIRQSQKNKPGIAESYNNIGALYFARNNVDRAIANLELALSAAQEAQDQNQILKSYDHLSACYKSKKDHARALAYKELQLALAEFIQVEKTQQSVNEAQNRYELDQKESQIGRLEKIRADREKRLQQQEQFRNFLFVLIGLGLVIFVLIFNQYLSKRRSNKVLQAVNRKVSEQNTQLQELNATKDKFFSIISHDLKGPLNSLTSFSGLLINHTDSLSKEEIRMLAKDLDKSLKNLFDLLENLLEWSRAQTGNIDFTPETFELQTLLKQNVGLLTAQAQAKDISLSLDDSPVTMVKAHKHSINTVIRNLTSNAIKFTPKGGSVVLRAQITDGLVTVSVRDSGVGMSTAVQQKLFRIDTKLTTKGTSDEKGTGLGLILCKEFVEKNGGTIRVESSPGKGSVFYVTIPVADVHTPAATVLS